MSEREQLKHWVDAWKRAGKELEQIRRKEIREIDTQRAIEAFNGLVQIVVRDHPPPPTSGLVEQQAWFSKLRQ